MKKTMSIVAITLMMAGSSVFACATCEKCAAKRADKAKSECTQCKDGKACKGCDAKKAEAPKSSCSGCSK